MFRSIFLHIPKGHPAIEAIISRSATKAAKEAGYITGVALHYLVPDLDLNQIANSFSEGLLIKRENEENTSGNLLKFPSKNEKNNT